MLTLLIVEDDQDLLLNLVELFGALELFGDIFSTKFGREAIELARSQQPSIVICDLGLSDISGGGQEVFRQLRADPRTRFIPVIFLTGSPSERNRCLALGADDFIEKPWNLKNLIRRIRNVILRYQEIEDKGRNEALSSLPVEAIVEESLSSLSALAQLILLDEDSPEANRRIGKQMLQRTVELTSILNSWKRSHS